VQSEIRHDVEPLRFVGTFTALVTPFDEAGGIDFAALEVLIERQISAGVSGIVVNGCTGEAALLELDEIRNLFFHTVKIVDRRIAVIAGTGRNTTYETVSLSAFAQEVGADAVMVILPTQTKPTQSGLISHYTAVADEIEIPLIIYNIPGRTAAKIDVATIVELSKHPQIAAVKEATGTVEYVPEMRSKCSISILSGDDALTLGMMAYGASGVVSVASNVAPSHVKSMVDAAIAGDFEKAREIHFTLMPLIKALFRESNPIPVKAAMFLLGQCSERLRLPLTSARNETIQELRGTIKALGLK